MVIVSIETIFLIKTQKIHGLQWSDKKFMSLLIGWPFYSRIENKLSFSLRAQNLLSLMTISVKKTPRPILVKIRQQRFWNSLQFQLVIKRNIIGHNSSCLESCIAFQELQCNIPGVLCAPYVSDEARGRDYYVLKAHYLSSVFSSMLNSMYCRV